MNDLAVRQPIEAEIVGPRPLYYKLTAHHRVRPCYDVIEWGRWFNKANRQVKLSNGHTVGKPPYEQIAVSTVFLGIDHNYSDVGPPLLFETLVFGGPHDQLTLRCSTWEEAEAQHARVCEHVLFQQELLA